MVLVLKDKMGYCAERHVVAQPILDLIDRDRDIHQSEGQDLGQANGERRPRFQRRPY